MGPNFRKGVFWFNAGLPKPTISAWNMFKVTFSRVNHHQSTIWENILFYFFQASYSPENSRMSPENQWLEDTFPIEILLF